MTFGEFQRGTDTVNIKVAVECSIRGKFFRGWTPILAVKFKSRENYAPRALYSIFCEQGLLFQIPHDYYSVEVGIERVRRLPALHSHLKLARSTYPITFYTSLQGRNEHGAGGAVPHRFSVDQKKVERPSRYFIHLQTIDK